MVTLAPLCYLFLRRDDSPEYLPSVVLFSTLTKVVGYATLFAFIGTPLAVDHTPIPLIPAAICSAFTHAILDVTLLFIIIGPIAGAYAQFDCEEWPKYNKVKEDVN